MQLNMDLKTVLAVGIRPAFSIDHIRQIKPDGWNDDIAKLIISGWATIQWRADTGYLIVLTDKALRECRDESHN